MTLLVTGATGTIGSGVVRELRARGGRPLALVRDPQRARERLGDGIDLAVGDLADPVAVRAAMSGADAVFLACGNVADQVTCERIVIDAAADAGVPRLVKLSARGADRDASNAYWRAHAEIEDHLAGSGTPAVVLRPSFLMSNLFAAAEHVRLRDCVMAPAGGAPIAMIDPADVAAVAVVALTDTTVGPGVLTLTGPEALTYAEVTRHLGDLVGRPLTYVDVPPEAMVAGLVQAGFPIATATEVVAVFGALRAGAQESTTDTVARLTGRAAGTFAGFARRHAAAFATAAPEPVGGSRS
jgi:uncharacterized protein YbjT (DUF2867 family)